MRQLLLLGSHDREAIRKVVSYSRARRHWYYVEEDDTTKQPPPGTLPGHVCKLLVGVRCVFSYTYLRATHTLCRHLSISVFGLPAEPNIATALAEEFGFRGQIDDWRIQLEDNCVVVIQAVELS